MVRYKYVLLVHQVDFDMSHYVHNYHFHTIGHYNQEHIDIQSDTNILTFQNSHRIILIRIQTIKTEPFINGSLEQFSTNKRICLLLTNMYSALYLKLTTGITKISSVALHQTNVALSHRSIE